MCGTDDSPFFFQRLLPFSLLFSGRLGPLFFDERSDARLPPAEELKEYGVVVTTYQRLTNEQPRWSDSPLSRIYWLRMVLVSATSMYSV